MPSSMSDHQLAAASPGAAACCTFTPAGPRKDTDAFFDVWPPACSSTAKSSSRWRRDFVINESNSRVHHYSTAAVVSRPARDALCQRGLSPPRSRVIGARRTRAARRTSLNSTYFVGNCIAPARSRRTEVCCCLSTEQPSYLNLMSGSGLGRSG